MTSEPRDPGEEPEADRTAHDEDALWRAIVDNYGDRAVLEDEEPQPEEEPEPRRSVRQAPEPAELAERYAHGDADEDHFVPPPPPPVPRTTPARLLAWVGLFGVPALVLVCLVAGVTLPPWLGLVLMGWFVGGFVFLVASMKPDDRDGYDDGAVL